MELKNTIQRRRAYRALEKVDIGLGTIEELAIAANLSASCFNNQPWRFVFVKDKTVLEGLHDALSKGNDWAKAASMIVAVFTKKDDDCVIRDREYYLFDTGMATAHLILRATDMGLIAHPIAGFSPKKVREVLGIPDEMLVITLVILGKHSPDSTELMNQNQIEVEKARPERQGLDHFVYLDRYQKK